MCTEKHVLEKKNPYKNAEHGFPTRSLGQKCSD